MKTFFRWRSKSNAGKDDGDGDDELRHGIIDDLPSPGTPQIGGYLMKRGLKQTLWRRRFFVFQGDHLEYRTDHETTEIKGVIPLTNFDIETTDAEKDFNIVTPGRTFFQRAETLQSKNNWVSELLALRRQISVNRGSHMQYRNNRVTKPASAAHCAKCSISFTSVSRRLQCDKCGYYYCSKPTCYSLVESACTTCHAPGLDPSIMGSLGNISNSLANLSVRIVEAKDLRPSDRNGMADPIAFIYAGAEHYATQPQSRTQCPFWDEQFDIPVDSENFGIQIAIFDHDKNGPCAFLGLVYIPLSQLKTDIMYDNWFPQKDKPMDAMDEEEDTNKKQQLGGPVAVNPPSNQPTQPFFEKKSLPPTGMVRLQLAYTYSPLALVDLMHVEESTRGVLSKRLISQNVKRAQRLYKDLNQGGWYSYYQDLLRWKRPLRTLWTFTVFFAMVLYYPLEWVPLLPQFVLFSISFCGFVERVVHEPSYPPLPDDFGDVKMVEFVNPYGTAEMYDVYETWKALRSVDEEEQEETEQVSSKPEEQKSPSILRSARSESVSKSTSEAEPQSILPKTQVVRFQSVPIVAEEEAFEFEEEDDEQVLLPEDDSGISTITGARNSVEIEHMKEDQVVKQAEYTANLRKEQINLLAQARKFHYILSDVQTIIGDVCTILEQVESIILWKDPKRSVVFIYVCVLAMLMIVFLPFRIILLGVGLEQFTSYFRKKALAKTKTVSKVEKFIRTAQPFQPKRMTSQQLNPSLALKLNVKQQ